MGRSLEGLVVLNVLFLLAGSGLLWAIRGWRSWGGWAADVGIAYMLGVATVCVASTLLLVFGASLSVAGVLVLTLAPAVGGASIGVLLGRPLPGRGGWSWLPRRWSDASWLLFVGAAAAVLFELARVMRTQALGNWDAWSFWLPKAKAIYYFGGLDAQMFHEITGQSYPLLVPALDAMDFRFMGSADTVTLGLQYWILLVGFVLAAAALLRDLAPRPVIWIFLASIVAMPEVDRSLPFRLADLPLDFFCVLAILALARWLSTGERLLLVFYGAMLAAMLATKREGQIFALAVVLGGVAAAGWRRKRQWVTLTAVAACAYAVNVPWRVWWSSRHLASDTPAGGLVHATLQYGRILPSLRLALRALFPYGDWRLAVPVALASALLALTTSRRATARLFLVFSAVAVVGVAWSTWSTDIPITTNAALNPTGRVSSVFALLSLVIAPALLGEALRGAPLRALLPSRRPAVATMPQAGAD